MQVMKWSVIALAVAAGTTQMAMASDQSESKGFVEDSSLSLLARSMYYNRDARNGGGFNQKAGGGFKSGYSEEWGASARAIFESGFTQGTVGVGVNAYAGTLFQLDTGSGRRGVNMLPGNDGKDLTIANAAVKARISNTVLTHGSQMPSLPVLAYDDGRLLPETFEGTMITSTEIEGLELNAGRFTAFNTLNQSGRDSGGLKSINVAGGSYSFTDNFSTALYYSDLEDTFEKKYGNLNYNISLTEDQALNFDFNIYKTDYDKKYTGTDKDQDNTIWSLAAKYSLGAHAFILAHQRSTGDRGYDYGVGDGGGTIFLANSYLSDFNQEDERSWQASYELDMATYGVPGLSFKTAYVWADNIKLADTSNDGKEHEFFNQVKYVVQEGAAKDLSLRVRSSVLRGTTGNSTGDTNEVRAYLEYPLSVL
ncbi:imipenem/basic amino acid-specific outer membrane pore [Pseudomonas peli]|uniref:Imipenem/basic amino acid-specific outer membrane pore n=1 Tax=Pseudomonas peli TaxID=592361 RepID=A0AB37Z895_9PSED|nr:OprD family outer membrane porin [Pseudomonas peli]NMZ70047.1 OprD family porin [Pseudomonas peli]SCW64900.1 imipenem/basic amino acid-specific outer membrane pore [Pseudomonas peli]